MRAAMAILFARVLAIFPLCHFGAMCTASCWKSMPCFGGLEPVLMALNSAFSAPSTWMVLAGSLAILSSPPALAMSLAPIVAPATCVMLGAILFMVESTASAIFSLSAAVFTASSARPTIRRMSFSEMVPPFDFSEASMIASAFLPP
jgi:hypothetical protein